MLSMVDKCIRDDTEDSQRNEDDKKCMADIVVDIDGFVFSLDECDVKSCREEKSDGIGSYGSNKVEDILNIINSYSYSNGYSKQ